MWTYDLEADVTAAQAARALGISRQVVAMWKANGKIKPVRRKGRSPLYRFGDVIDANADALSSGHSHRSPRPVAA
ncbi:hypothetical protein Drose_04285 [Dactylosporangium roseum]|uniref:Helix-turn-helix domain-containing protein n=1 Tax=Dactylosporangium roseum TaxID=47989 RepID=A0ABY5Z617_9ACTN|nr:hypothetical protein [Dactylosporangium roseum]UWZ37508.1 hypothetical protein Drose_04285 [Dactylosporangium roseum]